MGAGVSARSEVAIVSQFSLTASDLTPNVGMWWYFFTEIFDHFRLFFQGVFQVSARAMPALALGTAETIQFHLAIYVAPLCLRLDDPSFILLIQMGAISTWKSYPTLGDMALWAGFLGCFPEIIGSMSCFSLDCLQLTAQRSAAPSPLVDRSPLHQYPPPAAPFLVASNRDWKRKLLLRRDHGLWLELDPNDCRRSRGWHCVQCQAQAQGPHHHHHPWDASAGRRGSRRLVDRSAGQLGWIVKQYTINHIELTTKVV